MRFIEQKEVDETEEEEEEEEIVGWQNDNDDLGAFSFFVVVTDGSQN